MNDLKQLSKDFQWFAVRRVERVTKTGQVVIIGKSRLGRNGREGPKNGGGPTPSKAF